MKMISTPTKEIYQKVIKKDEFTIGALLKLYSFQTADERDVRGTMYQNDIGFNGTDSNFCSSLAEQYLKKGFLSKKQMAALRKILPKYWRQIPFVEPSPIKAAPVKAKYEPPAKAATLKKGLIHVTFPYNPDTITRVKTMPGRKWNKDKKLWTVPLSLDAVETLMSMGFDIEKGIMEWHHTQTNQEFEQIEVPNLRATLYPYQAEGVSFIDNRKGRALIGDEMGLGKTIQALAWLQLRKEVALPALIVVPASLKLNWAREALKFTDLEPVLISGKKKKTFTTFPGGTRADMYIVNYDIIHETTECDVCEGKKVVHGNQKCKHCKGKGKVNHLNQDLRKLKIKTAVFDECHYTKSNTAGRTAAAKELSETAEHIICLSGTPIVNRPVEFFNSINMVNNKIFPSWWNYTGRYCDRRNNGFGVDVSGASNTDELHKKLTRTIMLRRLKKDVLPQLPPKVRTVVPIEINTRLYHRIIDQAVTELSEADNQAQHLAIIEKAKQATVELKLGMCLDWIQNYIDSGQKLVVFAEHRKVIDQVAEKFADQCVKIYGGTTQNKRQEAVDRFMNDPKCKLFIGSKAAKEGLTLTAASATCFLELWWTPGDHDQAEDRVHRIGQEADSVTAYYLLAAGTIEEDIASLIDSKRKVLASVLDGKEVEDKSMLSALMKVLQETEKDEEELNG